MNDLVDKVKLNPSSEVDLDSSMSNEQSFFADDMIDIEEAKIETRIIGVESSQSSATIPENQSSNEKQSIATPEKNANTGSGKSHQCDICHKTYQTKKHLRQHIEVKHELPYVFKCQQCEVSFRFE